MSLKRYIPGLACTAIALLAACGSSTEPVLLPLPDETDEAVLFNLWSDAVTDPAAFDVISRVAVRTDQSSGWDFLFEVAEDGSATLWPRGAVVEDGTDAGLRPLDVPFDALDEAPEFGYVTRDSLPVAVGDVFAVRSRRDPVYGSIRCRRFGKIEVLSIDSAEGTLTFEYLINPNCERRFLVPGATE